MGVSVENDDYKYRIDDLRKTGAKVKFLSLAPLIGRIENIDLKQIDWVIVGGRIRSRLSTNIFGMGTDIRDQCIDATVPFFFKQWGGVNKKRNGRILEGKIWSELPICISKDKNKQLELAFA